MSPGVVVSEKFGPTSTTSERVEALAATLEVALVAKAADVTPTAVRKWIGGTEPRAEAAIAIDDLRAVVVVLLEAGFEPARIRSWLVSRDQYWLDGARPVECLAVKPMSVLSAANDAANAHRFGPQATAAATEARDAEAAEARDTDARDAA